jgi:hypothetical protein
MLDINRPAVLGCSPIASGHWDVSLPTAQVSPPNPEEYSMKKLLAAVVAFAFVSPVFAAEEKKVEEKKVEKKVEEKKVDGKTVEKKTVEKTVEKKTDEKKVEKK